MPGSEPSSVSKHSPTSVHRLSTSMSPRPNGSAKLRRPPAGTSRRAKSFMAAAVSFSRWFGALRFLRRPIRARSVKSRLFVVLDPLEDKHDVGGVFGGEVSWPIALRNARARHANGPRVTLQFVDAVLLFPLLRAALVQVVDRLGALLGIDGDRSLVFALWRLAGRLAVGSDDIREVRDAVLGERLPPGLHGHGLPLPLQGLQFLADVVPVVGAQRERSGQDEDKTDDTLHGFSYGRKSDRRTLRILSGVLRLQGRGVDTRTFWAEHAG